MKIAMLLIVLSSVSQARDLTPSIGITYAQTEATSSYSPFNLIQGVHEKSYLVDLLWPVCQWLDLSVSGGPTRIQFDSLTPNFALETVTVGYGGGLIGTYGQTGGDKRSYAVNGYNLKASARFYFK